MSIFYITGKPRGGKSYLAVEAIYKELCDPSSKRFIVTNIALNFGAIADWLHKDGIAHEVNLKERVRILTDEETGEFWCYEPNFEFKKRKKIKVNRRGTEIEVPDFSYDDDSVRGDSSRDNPGTFYVIDEVHIFFPARAWQRTGEDCTYFLSQHGKMKCDVCMVTQHVDQCDKALRRLAQEYMTVRNLSREPVLGFRLGSLFRFSRMLNSPTSSNPYVFDSGFKTMDFAKYGSMYDTSAGVGITGSMVPNVEKKGRSLWWLLIPAVGFIAFWLNFGKLAHGFQHAITGGLKHAIPGFGVKMASAMNIPNTASAGAVASSSSSQAGAVSTSRSGQENVSELIPSTNSAAAAAAVKKTKNLPVWNLDGATNLQVVGWCRTPVVTNFFLSNGRQLPLWAVHEVSDYAVTLYDGTVLPVALPSAGVNPPDTLSELPVLGGGIYEPGTVSEDKTLSGGGASYSPRFPERGVNAVAPR